MLIHDAERNSYLYDYEEELDEYNDFVLSCEANVSDYRFRKFYVVGFNKVCISAADSLQDLLGAPDSISEQVGGLSKPSAGIDTVKEVN